MKDSANIVSEQHNDEIDLIEIIRFLWSKKLFIILVTCFTTLLAGIYAFTAKEQWTSKATLLNPNLTELRDYLKVRREYSQILREDPIDPSKLSTSLFNNFSRLARSQDIKNEFFVNSNIYKKLVEDKDEREQRTILFQLSTEATGYTIPDAKKTPHAIGRTLAFSSETPIEAQDTLNALIHFINKKAFNLELEDFLIDFQNVLAALKYEKLSIQEDSTINKSVKLENLNKAYEMAQKAGIKEYSRKFHDANPPNTTADSNDAKIPLSEPKLADSSFLFLLGEKYLKAQIDIANEKGVAYPPRYYQIDYQLKQLETLFEKTKKVKAQTYSYHASPDYPVTKDKPQKALILAIGGLLGIIFSSLVIVIVGLLKRSR